MRRICLAAAMGMPLLSLSAMAASDTWDGSTSVSWSDATNWFGELAAPGSGETATFSLDATTVNNNTTIDLGAGVTIGQVLFDTSSAAAYTIGAGAAGSQMLTLDNGGAITVNAAVANNQLFDSAIVLGTDGTAQTFTLTNNSTSNSLTFAAGITGSTGTGVKTVAVAGTGSISISGVISNGASGTVAVSKSDGGTTILSGANTYTGGTTISAGTLQLTNVGTNNSGPNKGAFTLGGGALQINQSSNNFNYVATLNLTADSTFSNLGTGAINHTGAITGNTHALTVNNTGSRLYINGAVSGITQFNVTAGAMGFDLGGGNSGGGAPVIVSNGASLWVVNSNVTSTNNITLNGGAGSNSTGALFQENSANTSTLSGTVTLNSTSSIGVGHANGTMLLSGQVTGAGGITKIGSGALTLSNSANDYSGATTISSGTLQIGNGGTTGALGSGDVTNNAALTFNRSDSFTVSNNIGGTGILTKLGAGTLTLSGTSKAVKTLQLNAGAVDIGANNLTISNAGGNTINSTLTSGTVTINATGGGKIVLTQNHATDGPDIGIANGGTLVINAAITGTSAYENWTGTANGTGVTVLTGQNDYTGNTIINGGVLSVANIGNTGSTTSNLGQSSTISIGVGATSTGTLRYTGTGETSDRVINLGGTTAGGTIEQSGTGLLKFGSALTATGGGAKTLTLQGSTAGTGELAGAIVDNTTTNRTSVTKVGTGIWTLSGANTYTGGTRANAGTLVLSGSHTKAGATTDFLSINNVGAQNAVLKIVSGANLGHYDMPIAEVTNARGAVYQSGGALSLASGFRVGSGLTSYGYYSFSGGTLTNTGNDMNVGAGNSATGVMDVAGGSITTSSWIVIGRGDAAGSTSSGLLNVTGGSVTSNSNNIALNWAKGSGAISILNVGGGAGAASVTGVSNAANYLDVSQVSTTGATGVVNLRSNGTLTAAQVRVSGAASTALFNFDGGTLKATAANAGANFMNSGNMDAVTVYSGGGTIDNNGTNITIGNALGAATGNGVTSIAVTNGGSGYIGAPLVKLTGGTGNTATGYAVMTDDGTGNGTLKVSSIVITSPGTYSLDPTTVTLTGGGATTAATIGAITTAANTSGGMTFTGGGITTLPGLSTYTGGTTLSTGALAVGHNNALGSGSLTFAGGVFTNSANVTISNSIVIAGNGEIRLNLAQNFTLDGTLSGSGSILVGNQNSNSSVYLNVTNTMSSGTIVLANNTNSVRFGSASAGNANVAWTFNNVTNNRNSLDFADGGTIHFGSVTGSGTFGTNATGGTRGIVVGNLGYNDVFSGAIRNNVAGSGSTINVEKVGPGTWTLTGANNQWGATTISNGKLLVNGTHVGGDDYTINAGTLGGSGTITLASGKKVQVNANGTVAPGNSPGTLTLNGDMIIGGGTASTLEFEFVGTSGDPADETQGGVDFDVINISGTLNLGGARLNIVAPHDGVKYHTPYTIATAGNIVGAFGQLNNQVTTSGQYRLAYPNYNVTITDGATDSIQITFVPEPATLGFIAIAACLLPRRRR